MNIDGHIGYPAILARASAKPINKISSSPKPERRLILIDARIFHDFLRRNVPELEYRDEPAPVFGSHP
jgi:hypothetical protein